MSKLMRDSRSVVALSLLLAIAIGSTARADAKLRLYVATNGNDRWSGRLAEPKDGDGPFLSLQRARDAIRKLKQQGKVPPNGLLVEIRGGVYELSAPLTLTAEDSGARGTPIVWRARPGEEVRIVGGKRLAHFQPVTDPATLKRLDPSARDKVLQADLRAAGIKDFGQVAGDNRLELFFQDRPMTLARWPNAGFVHIVDLLGGKPVDVRGPVLVRALRVDRLAGLENGGDGGSRDRDALTHQALPLHADSGQHGGRGHRVLECGGKRSATPS